MSAQHLALAAGILAQVHLTAIEVEDAAEQYRLARELYAARKKQLEAIQLRVESGEAGQHAALRLEAETLIAKTRMLTAFADLQVAQARLSNTLGREPATAPGELSKEITPAAVSPEDFSAPAPEPLPTDAPKSSR